MSGLDLPDDQIMEEYEKILEEIGFGKAQWTLIIIAGLFTLFGISVQRSVGIIAIASQCDFEMNQREKGFMMAAGQIGLCVSTYFWGFISDIFGRRGVLLWSTLATCALMFVAIFITNIWCYNVINLIIGVGLGGSTGALFAMLSEFNTSKHRATVINFATLFSSISTVYVAGTAWLVLSFDWSWDIMIGMKIRPWRLLLLFMLLPGLIGALWLLKFPESPKFLLAQGKELEAIDAIDWICQYNRGWPLLTYLKRTNLKLHPEKISEDIILISQSRGCTFLAMIWRATLPLFHKQNRRNVLLSIGIVFLLFFGSKGLVAWYPEIVNRTTGQNAMQSDTICELLGVSFDKQMLNQTQKDNDLLVCVDEEISRETFINNIIYGSANALAYTVQGLISRTLDYRYMLYGGFIIAALSSLLLQFVTNSIFVLILFCLYMIMTALAISTMLGAIVNFLPTPLRGKTVSICITFGYLGVIISTNLIGIALENMCIGMFAIFTVCMSVSVVMSYFLR